MPGTIFIVGIVSAVVMVPFKAKLSVGGMGIHVMSCGFWYLFLVFLVQISTCFALVDTIEKKGKDTTQKSIVLHCIYYYSSESVNI